MAKRQEIEALICGAGPTKEVRRRSRWGMAAIAPLVAVGLLAGCEARAQLRGRALFSPEGSVEVVARAGRPVRFAYGGCRFEAELLRRWGQSVLRLQASRATAKGQMSREVPAGLDVVRFLWSPPASTGPRQDDRSCRLACASFFLPGGSVWFTCKSIEGTDSEP